MHDAVALQKVVRAVAERVLHEPVLRHKKRGQRSRELQVGVASKPSKRVRGLTASDHPLFKFTYKYLFMYMHMRMISIDLDQVDAHALQLSYMRSIGRAQLT